MPLKTGNLRRVTKSRPVCMGLEACFIRRILVTSNAIKTIDNEAQQGLSSHYLLS
jgi:hypothetical protein